MKLSRLKEIAEKSAGELSPLQMANCQRTLKNYSTIFNVRLSDLQNMVEEYYEKKYGKLAQLPTYQFSRAAMFEKNVDANGYTQRTFFHLELRNHKYDWVQAFFLFSLDTTNIDISSPDFEVNLLKTGFIKSFVQAEANSKIKYVKDDLNEIGWACIIKNIKDKYLTRETEQNI
ncbi:MAG: hypothetical protein J6A28_02290 [Clostridia bacterium]|nr:hypothetical protein [Clostridia bacterium]